MSGSIGLPPIPTYLSIVKDEPTAAAKAEAGDATTKAAVARFEASAGAIKTPQELLSNYPALTVVLGAFGLSSAIGETAVLKDLLTQNPSASTSLAAKSANPLWIRFADAMSGWSSGSTPLSASGSVTTIANQYIENQFEAKQGQATPGMQQALYFTRTIGSDKGNLNALMSDPSQLDVVETVLGFDPSQFGALQFSQQQAILKKDVNFSAFSNKASIQRYAEQFLAIDEINPPSTTASYSVGSLFGGADGSDSLLEAIGQSLSVQA